MESDTVVLRPRLNLRLIFAAGLPVEFCEAVKTLYEAVRAGIVVTEELFKFLFLNYANKSCIHNIIRERRRSETED